MNRHLITFLFSICLSGLLFPCSCNWTITEFTAKDFIDYDVIFEGKLDTIYDRGNYKILPFKVTKIYKGVKSSIVDIVLYGSTCDPEFKIGKKYKIFAEKEYGGPLYTVNKCGHTHELNSNKDFLQDAKDSDSLSIYVNGKSTRLTIKEIKVLTLKLAQKQDSILNSLCKLDSGLVMTHFINGQISATGKFKNGKPEGLWKFYYPDGSVYEIGTYKYGIKNGYWEEYLSPYAFYPIRKGKYLGGECCGKWKWYNNKGKLVERRSYDKKCVDFK